MMLVSIRRNKGQAMMAEYVIVIFLAIGAIVAMSTFVQRALQARIRGAEQYMIRQSSNAHGNLISYEYEPYYGNVETVSARNQDDETALLDGGTTGIFRKAANQQVLANTFSVQAPPKDAQ